MDNQRENAMMLIKIGIKLATYPPYIQINTQLDNAIQKFWVKYIKYSKHFTCCGCSVQMFVDAIERPVGV